MYHPAIIRKKLDSWVAAVPGRVLPTYYTQAQVTAMVKQIDTTRSVDDKGAVTVLRPYTAQEIAFIQNQRVLCRLDFHYFASRFCFIKNAHDQVVQFSPWISQRIYLDTIAEMEEKGLAIMLIVLKARQLGLSRITSMLILHRAIFFPNVNAVIASSTPDKTRLLADMLDYVFDRLPFWLIPELTARREGEFIEFGKADTGITLQHGSQMSGIARGTTPTVGHLSELAEFDNPKSIVDASLLRAMHDSPRTFLVLEGTAEGQHNWWHKKWMSSKELWPQNKSRLRPLFLPWFCGTDLYPTAAWLLAHPVPDSYQPEPFVIDHARRSAEFVRSNSLLDKYLASGTGTWTMPLSQQWFYEVERGQASKEGRLNEFLQEMPASDDEAFQSTNISIFDVDTLTAHRDRTLPPIDITDPQSRPCVYGLSGPEDLIPARCQPHYTQLDRNKKPVEILCNWSTSYPQRFTLQPLKWDGYSSDIGKDQIYFWEQPMPGELYAAGVDTGFGIQKDNTALEFIRKGSIYAPAAQVCEFVSGKLNALDASPFVLALATYYSVPDGTRTWEEEIQDGQTGAGGRRQCRVAIECKGNGEQAQLRMRFFGWHNFHPWKRIDDRKLDPSQYNKIGVHTNSWFRDAMMEYMLKMLRDMELEIRSPFFVQEMQSLEMKEMNQVIKAAGGAHDDRFMSLGFAIVTLYQWERERNVSTFASVPQRPAAPGMARRYARYSASGQDRASTL